MSLYNISKGLKANRSKFIGNILHDYQYGNDLETPSDYNSLAKSYRGWAYIAGSRNAVSVAQADP